jgi:hypothetical protein
MKKWVVLLASFVVFFLAGCTSFKASNLAVMPPGANYTSLGNFHTTVLVNGFLGGSAGTKLFNVSSDVTDEAVSHAIEQEIKDKGGTGAINITIEHRASFIQALLNSFTMAIWAPAEIYITGTVIK